MGVVLRNTGLFVLIVAVALAPAVGQSPRQDAPAVSPFAGTWQSASFPEQFAFAVRGTDVFGNIGPAGGPKAPLSDGQVNGSAIAFTAQSPDGERTLTFKGVLNGKTIAFTRAVSGREGGPPGEDGVFGASGPATFSVTLRSTLGAFTGRVVDKTTGEPLTSATVTISRSDEGGGRMTRKSSDSGTFTFDNLPEGPYVLSAAMDHYVPQKYVQPGPEEFSFVQLLPGERVENIEIPMTKTGVISGTVTDRNGLAMRNASITILERVKTEGKDELQAARKGTVEPGPIRPQDLSKVELRTSTNHLGAYRLEDLKPGDYYIQVYTPIEMTYVRDDWSRRRNALAFGDQGTLMDLQRCPSLSRTDDLDPIDSPSDIGLPAEAQSVPRFYPGVANAADAATVSVPPGGEIVGIDIAMKPTPLGRLHVSLVREPGAPGVQSGPQEREKLNIAIMTTGLGASRESFACVDETGSSFDFNDLLPGRYRVIAGTTEGDRMLTAVRDIDIREGMSETATLQLKSGVDLHGQIYLDSYLPPGLDLTKARIALDATELAIYSNAQIRPASVRAQVQADGSFLLRDVMTGVPYRIGYIGLDPARTNRITARYRGEIVGQALTVAPAFVGEEVRFEVRVEPAQN